MDRLVNTARTDGTPPTAGRRVPAGFTLIKPFDCAQGKLPAVRERKAKGFTLIELLVVMAIIALLISVLVPTLGQARVLAGLAMCKVNMRNIHVAMQAYVDNNQNVVPITGTYKRSAGGVHFYSGRFDKYQTPKLFFAGCLAAEEWIADPGMLACPGTNHFNPKQDVRKSTLFKVPLKQWVEDPGTYTAWGHYSLRWSGRKDWVYNFKRAQPRLMIAEVAGGHQTDLREMRQHGGIWIPSGAGGLSMNLLGSDGSIATIRDYSNRTVWQWSDTWYYGGGAPPQNERTGDVFNARWPEDQWDYSDTAHGFWASFDRQIFRGTANPWCDDKDHHWWPNCSGYNAAQWYANSLP